MTSATVGEGFDAIWSVRGSWPWKMLHAVRTKPVNRPLNCGNTVPEATRTTFHALQTPGIAENMRNPEQSKDGKNPSGAKSVNNVLTLFLRSPWSAQPDGIFIVGAAIGS